jgi:transposase-like protein
MASVGAEHDVVKLYEWIQDRIERGREAYVRALQHALQAYVDQVVREQVGRGRGERERPGPEARSAWRCSRCGSQRQCDFNYSGSYRRGLAFAEGWVQLRIPRLRCRCGGNVRADFGALLPARQRLWYDLILAVLELLPKVQSLRAVPEHLERHGVRLGLSSLARMLGAFAEVDINAGGAEGAEALSLDAAFWPAGGASWAHLYVHEVRRREEPLVRRGREVAWYQTGKVPAVGVAPAESQVAWEAVLGEARTAGLIDPEGAPFVATDGNSGLLAAVAMELPWAVVQRCVWHIGYRTRGKIRNPAHRDALERDALWIFRAADVAAARRRLTSFMERWRELEPEAAASVGRKFPAGVEYLRHPERAVRPRTIAISERYNQEAKRRFRPGRGFGSERNLQAMVRLLALRHNCRLDRIDWLEYAARWRWDQPVEPTTAYQHESRDPDPYTKDGT